MAGKGYVVKRTICDGTYSYPCASLKEAFAEWGEMVALGALAIDIFAVHPDGREERLPSYEETLAGLQTVSDVLAVFGVPDDGTGLPQRLQLLHEGAHDDPIAALEAAERRLLEAGGWKPGDRGFWVDPNDGTQWPREGAISDVRRQQAAKGGA